jgi:hypothetical protein
MTKIENIIKTGAYVYDWTVQHNIEFPSEGVEGEEGEEGVQYKSRVTINFDVKGENIIKPQEAREFYSEPSSVMLTALEATEWVAANILNFIYAGKDDIAGYSPQQ